MGNSVSSAREYAILVVDHSERMSVEKRAWRRSPISPLAHSIRMDTVRQANIYPTCRLDKHSRAVYEPEDVWVKRANLARPDSRGGASWARDMFKQKVLAISTAGVTKANMDVVDRVKEVRHHLPPLLSYNILFYMLVAVGNIACEYRMPFACSLQNWQPARDTQNAMHCCVNILRSLLLYLQNVGSRPPLAPS